MSYAVQCDYCPTSYLGGFRFGSPGLSAESDLLSKKNRETQERELERTQESGLLRASNSRVKLDELYKDCNKADWNGRDASPIPREAIIDAELLIAQIPEKYPMPEIIPETTGEIGLEWYIDPYRVLLLSVAGDGFIYYAGLYGFKNTDHGSKPFAGKLHKKIIALLDDIYKEPTT